MEYIRQLSVMNDSRQGYGYNSGKEVELPTLRGHLRFRVEERQDHSKKIVFKKHLKQLPSFFVILAFAIHWKGHRIPVVRPNVVCTNGIIHVIDFPFLLDSDVQIGGVARQILAPSLFIFLIVKWILL